MIVKIVGFSEFVSKNNKPCMVVHYLYHAKNVSGLAVKTDFVPPYSFDFIKKNLDNMVSFSFGKYNDQYQIKGCYPIDSFKSSSFNDTNCADNIIDGTEDINI